MGFFHLRLKDMPNDFILLSPLDPETGGLSNYSCFGGPISWFFCAKCGVRCFAFWGTGEVSEIDLEEWLGKSSEGKKTKVWRPRPEGWTPDKPKEFIGESVEGKNAYMSVNAHTLEPGQEGLDLREWHEKKWILYLDCKDDKEENRYVQPHDGGIY